MNARTNHGSTLHHSLQGQRNEFTGWREDNRSLQRLWRLLRRVSSPHGSQFAGEVLPLCIPGTRERINLAALMASHLNEDVGGGTKSVETKPARITRHRQSSVSNQASAKQRSRI